MTRHPLRDDEKSTETTMTSLNTAPTLADLSGSYTAIKKV